MQVDEYGIADALARNNRASSSRATTSATPSCAGARTRFATSGVVPPDTGIVHQVNLEHLARVVFARRPTDPASSAYPDTLVGTDSHTTMVNGLGVLGWGVGGIEAEAAMLGQPMSHAGSPGRRRAADRASCREGATATDLVLTVTEILRKLGVVGKFVEFFGPGLAETAARRPRDHRQHGARVRRHLRLLPDRRGDPGYLRLTGRPDEMRRPGGGLLPRAGPVRRAGAPEPSYTKVVELDMASVEPCVAGPRRPQDRVPLPEVKKSFEAALPSLAKAKKPGTAGPTAWAAAARDIDPEHGSLVLAAITSCTNTSNPSVLMAAGLLAKKAVERGLASQALGEDVAGAGLAGGHRLPAAAGLLAYARNAWLPRGGLRLHHLHRQLGTAGSADIAGHRANARWWWRRCCLATATSKAACIPKCAPTTWLRRRWWWPLPWPVGWTSISTRSLGQGPRRPAGLPARHLAATRQNIRFAAFFSADPR